MRLEHSTPSISLLLTGALLALGACGDDGSGTPETTTGEDSTTSAMPTTTTDASADTTVGPADDTTTDDTATGATTATTDPTETDSDTETSMGGPVSFRFNSIELTDPGAGLNGPCGNADQVNALLATPIANDEDDDGFIDMSFVLDFTDLVQTDGATGAVSFANAQCDAPDGDMCGLLPDSDLYPATYTIMTKGTCLEATAGNIEPGTGNTGTTMGPCFVTDNIDATVVTSAVSLPLTDVRVAAQMVGDPPGNLVSGTLEGFLSEADAMASMVEVVGMQFQLSELLCAEQMDGGGWWMHMNFTAVTTMWNG